jgi:hypothetical protein
MGEGPTTGELEMTKIRLDYAWKYFDSAARQRMLFLNFFLIAVGVLGSAFGFAVKEGAYSLAVGICIFGVVVSASFIAFDMRMLAFVNRALKILETLERLTIFPDGFNGVTVSGKPGTQLGLARVEPDTEGAVAVPPMADGLRGMSVRFTNGISRFWRYAGKVKIWVRLIEGMSLLGFLLGIILVCTMDRRDHKPQNRTAVSIPAYTDVPSAQVTP